MPRAFAIVLAAALFLFPAAIVRAQGQKQIVDLRPKWEKGQEIRYRMEQSSTSTTNAPDLAGLDEDAKPAPAPAPAKGTATKSKPAKGSSASHASDNAQTMVQAVEFRFKVIDADPEGGAVVHLIYDRLKVSTTSPLGKQEFDSMTPKEKDGDNPLAAAARPLVGATLVLTLDRDGNITKVEGDSLLPGGLGGSPTAGLSDPNAVKQTWGQIFTTRRAGGRATVGETWTTTDSLDTSPLGSFLIKTENRLKSHNAGNALVDFKGTISPGAESAGNDGLVQVKECTHDGAYTWDTQRGQLKELNMTQKVNIEVHAGTSTITSKQDSKTSIKRVN